MGRNAEVARTAEGGSEDSFAAEIARFGDTYVAVCSPCPCCPYLSTGIGKLGFIAAVLTFLVLAGSYMIQEERGDGLKVLVISEQALSARVV